MPALMAATLLMGIVFFLFFAFSAWLIFGKRGELAARTLREVIIPEIEQSRLPPGEKAESISELDRLADGIEQGSYENWQAGGIMQRLVNSPLLRWGDLRAIEAWTATHLSGDEEEEARKQISRFFRAVELDRTVARDVHHILEPVSLRQDDNKPARLRPELSEAGVREVVHRAKLIADRAEVPDRTFEPLSLPHYIRRQVEIGRREGAP